ncbi:MAG: lysylphosphatidylglycerol synthase transmembrane domain-containing protein [Anaerolineaceae bacterium]
MTNPEKRIAISWKLVFWVPALFLLWWALRKAPFNEIGALLARLDLSSVLLLVCLNFFILLGFSSRWKMILHTLGEQVSLIKLVSYRLAGFAVSYFTPGTQFGGEPLQAFLLLRGHTIKRDDAISSIYLDKLIEIFVNFSVLLIGLAISLRNGLFRDQIPSLVGISVFGIGLFPVAYFILLWKGFQPATKLMGFIYQKLHNSQFLGRALEVVENSENRIFVLVSQNPSIIIKTIGLSLVVWGLMFVEYHLMWMIVGQPLSLIGTIFAMTLMRIAFLLPLPGGIGAMEASQVLAMGLLGYDPTFGLAACFWIRTRDITFGVLGFLFASLEFQTAKIKTD